MNDTLKNMMEDVMKNYENFNPLNFAKNFEMPKEWDTSNIGQQIIDFQKNVFNNSYNTMVKIQEQTDKMTDTFLSGNTAIPSEGRKFIDEWKLSVKKSQEDLKKQIEDGFNTLESVIQQSEKKESATKAKAASSK